MLAVQFTCSSFQRTVGVAVRSARARSSMTDRCAFMVKYYQFLDNITIPNDQVDE